MKRLPTYILTIVGFLLALSPDSHAQVCCDMLGSSESQSNFGFQQPQSPGLIPTPNGGALFGPTIPDAYGPGLNSDATGRPFYWAPQGRRDVGPDPTLRVQPNAYGPGLGMDQYGRPVRPACPPGWAGRC